MFGKALLAIAPALSGGPETLPPVEQHSSLTHVDASDDLGEIADSHLEEQQAIEQASNLAVNVLKNEKFKDAQVVYGMYPDGRVQLLSTREGASADALKMLEKRISSFTPEESFDVVNKLLSDPEHNASIGFGVRTGVGEFKGRIVLIDAPVDQIIQPEVPGLAASRLQAAAQSQGAPQQGASQQGTPATSTDPNAEILKRLEALEKENAELRAGAQPRTPTVGERLLDERMQYEQRLRTLSEGYGGPDEAMKRLPAAKVAEYIEVVRDIQRVTGEYVQLLETGVKSDQTLSRERVETLRLILDAEKRHLDDDTKRLTICTNASLAREKMDKDFALKWRQQEDKFGVDNRRIDIDADKKAREAALAAEKEANRAREAHRKQEEATEARRVKQATDLYKEWKKHH